ncbi:MAG TPA: TatD family hydrolase, partial [candidate division Zixibacteria bacterium]|nr:TatD family hydrolase [candidate division Zixibacteria bacterium]
MLIDSHCHLDFESFDVDREQVMQRAGEAGVSRVVVPSLGLDNCGTVIGLTGEFPGVFAAVGIHPNYSMDWQEEWIEELRQLAHNDKVVAIGEIGLDYYRDYSSKELQLRALEAQLQLAAELELPVVLHNRESDGDLLDTLKKSGKSGQYSPGVFHSFSTSWQTAVAALDMGYYLGFSGPVT